HHGRNAGADSRRALARWRSRRARDRRGNAVAVRTGTPVRPRRERAGDRGAGLHHPLIARSARFEEPETLRRRACRARARTPAARRRTADGLAQASVGDPASRRTPHGFGRGGRGAAYDTRFLGTGCSSTVTPSPTNCNRLVRVIRADAPAGGVT